MKKIIFTTAAILAIGFANAQETIQKGFSKGDIFVEGAFSIRTGNTSQGPADIKKAYGFNPSVGYMINNKIALGVDLDIASSEFYGVNTQGSHKTGTFGVGGFARYYFLQLGESKSFNAYGHAGLGFSSTRAENLAGKDNDLEKSNGMKFDISLGMNYFFTSHWAATFELANLVSYNTLSQGGNSTSGLDVNINKFNNIFATPQFGLLYKW